jgi:large subunit ribosomal protein L24
MACHIRRDDQVIVIAGAHKGEKGRVLRVNPTKEQVVVQGVNMVYKHARPSRRNPQGGRIRKEMPIHISNVLPVDPKSGKPTRVRFEVEKDDQGRMIRKLRVAKRSGAELGEVTRAKVEK